MVFLAEAIPALSQGQMSNIWLMAHFQKKVNKRQIKKVLWLPFVDHGTEWKKRMPVDVVCWYLYRQTFLMLVKDLLNQVNQFHCDITDSVYLVYQEFTSNRLNIYMLIAQMLYLN